MKGVMYSDALQGGIMFVGMAFLIFFVYAKLGGVTNAHKALTDMMNDPGVIEQTSKLTAKGFVGWTSMPTFGSPYWWTVVSSVIMGVGIGVLAQPQLIIRFMTVKSNRELNRAVTSGSIFILFMTGVAFVVGALSNVLFFQKMGKTAMSAAGGVVDNIIPTFLKEFMPDWFGTVFLLVLLAAAMSTLSSQFHVVGTSIGRDIMEKTFKFKGSTITVTRIGIVFAILVTAVLTWLGNQIKTDIGLIAQATSIFFGLCAAAFLPAYIGALYSKKLSRAAAISSIVTGFAVSFIWIFFIHAKNAGTIGLCQLLTGKANILAGTGGFLESLTQVDSVLIAFPLALVVLVVVGLLTRSELEEAHVNACFEGIR
jgi:solute:Na+ symporter, SSS family